MKMKKKKKNDPSDYSHCLKPLGEFVAKPRRL